MKNTAINMVCDKEINIIINKSDFGLTIDDILFDYDLSNEKFLLKIIPIQGNNNDN